MAASPKHSIIESTLTLLQIRLLIIIGAALLGSFMFADLALLPSSLKPIYIQSRIYIQIPLCVVFLALSWHPAFLRQYQSILATIMLGVTFANFWLIIQCWQREGFSFPYEGTVMYSLFTLIVFRMSLRTGLCFSALVITSFGVLVLTYPIYGANSGVNFGFVVIGPVVGLISIYQVERVLKKLSAANTNLSTLSQIDSLTEIYNRRTYETRFSDQLNINKRAGNSICVFIIDLDNFKDYNDGYGHVQGDKIIKKQADHLTSIFRRETDIVARYGGEEFIVVTSQVTHSQCCEFAQRILDQWATDKVRHGKGNGREFMSCSVGFYIEQVTLKTDKEQMVKNADKALYQAKANGRNQFVEYIESST